MSTWLVRRHCAVSTWLAVRARSCAAALPSVIVTVYKGVLVGALVLAIMAVRTRSLAQAMRPRACLAVNTKTNCSLKVNSARVRT